MEFDDENTTLIVFEENGDIQQAKKTFAKNLIQEVELKEDQTYDDVVIYFELVQPLSVMLNPGANLLTNLDVAGVDWTPQSITAETCAPGFGGFAQ